MRAILILLTVVGCAAIQKLNTTPGMMRNQSCLESPKLQVFQVLPDGILANLCPVDFPSYYDDAFEACSVKGDTVYLPVEPKSNDYVDDQKVTLPKDKCFEANGTYKYSSKGDILRTVRRIKIVGSEIPKAKNEQKQ